ncbi:TetR/AcrR family transcriptional regulator [Oceanidesulfovibrio marinus]|uniref:TetR/AcrR family transcriptional regulator n=1 Tax=Oceanidesulfovibrio marinus TaxID=370038 RepID=A0ABX6NAH6_9BACT|nr:TetR/AcrR family transcriptional regulator [Oceanidesulfovibrio marinus]QJT07594.1 TetR/AcrR family transcriptional regulator [Oceanidesulfovibrio marinus]
MTKPTAGRPRSEESLAAILRATNELLREQGPCAMTVEGIARRAGVGKQTIYRWWPSKADVVLEAIMKHEDMAIIAPDTGSLHDDLHECLRRVVATFSGWAGCYLRCLIVHAQMDEAFRDRFQDNFVQLQRTVLDSVFAKAGERGEINPEADLGFADDMVFGMVWYRLLNGHAPLDDGFAAELATAVLAYILGCPSS